MGGGGSRAVINPDTRRQVQQLVQANCVVIFSKTTCPYCTMAKKVFEGIGQPYTVVELNQRKDGRDVQQYLLEMTGARTVPRVFVNGQCIGGGSETKQLHSQGALLPLIASCAPQGRS